MLRPSVPCCMLLDVVACWFSKFETGQTFQPTTLNISFVPWSPKRSAIMLNPFAQLFQHCWGHVHSLRMDYKDFWVVSFPRCTAGPNIVGSCCIRLHTTAKTRAPTPNIVGATMLGVVASVCTQPKVTSSLTKQPTFHDATTGFPEKWHLRIKWLQKLHIDDIHYIDMGNASDWLCHAGNLILPIRSTMQIWVVTRNQNGISALNPQTSFRVESNGSAAKCGLFS